jgi:HEPN domain-containing protein
MTDPTRQIVHDWLTRAQHDLAAARKLSTEPDPYLDAAIYHCQQAAEKAVKGFLTWRAEPLQRTHDVRRLVEVAEAHEPGFSVWRAAAARLNPYATEFRYPGGPLEPPRPEFDQALVDATAIYEFVLTLVPDDVRPAG